MGKNEKRREKRSKIITKLLKYCYFLIAIIVAILLGLIVIKVLWPKDFSQKEKNYYQEMAENAWNKGLKSIAKQVKRINNNCLYIEPLDKFDIAYIDFNEIKQNRITIHLAKKGEIIYYFSETNETIPLYKSKSVPKFFCTSIAIGIIVAIVVLYMLANLWIFIKLHIRKITD